MDTGIIEGFFGKPWTFLNRKSVVKFMREAGLNTYVYAPKEDPYHRKEWSRLYPRDLLKQFDDLIRLCRTLDIDFNFALSPGLSIRYSKEEQFDALRTKCDQMADLGIRSFSLFFDDIDPILSVLDQRRFSLPSHAQVYMTNRIYSYLKTVVRNLKFYFCPTEYRGVKSTPYLEYIGKHLGREIKIFWTGRSVISNKITSRDALGFGKIIRRKPLLWDNYPVNDYDPNRLFLGPLSGRDRNLLESMSGVFFNPMNQANTSIIALASCSLYVRTPELYNADRIWPVMKRIYGNSGDGEIFMENFKPSLIRCRPTPMALYIKKQTALLRKGRIPDRAGLLRMSKELTDLDENAIMPNLAEEIRPYLNNLKLCGSILRLIARGGKGKHEGIKRKLKALKTSRRREAEYYLEDQVLLLAQAFLRQDD